MALPVQSYRKWAKVFRKGGARFLHQDGKNHFIWAFRPAGMQHEDSISIPAHSEGDDVKPQYITALRKIWFLREADGVSDHDFMEGNWPK
jgi:hypothetical protein